MFEKENQSNLAAKGKEPLRLTILLEILLPILKVNRLAVNWKSAWNNLSIKKKN